MSNGEIRSDQMYFAMWRMWSDFRFVYLWVATGDPDEFSDAIIDWAYQSKIDNYEPVEGDIWCLDRPKRPSSLRRALGWIHYMNEGCGGQFVWFKASADRYIEVWKDGAS